MTPPPSSHEQERAAPKPRRAACMACRERKVRCSGSQPCSNCVRRESECFFEHERKIVVSERYLNELKRKAEDDQLGPDLARANRRLTPPEHREGEVTTREDDNDQEISNDHLKDLRNPLVTNSPSFMTDNKGKRRFLGPSSTWAYSRHAMNMIQAHLGEHFSPDVPMNVDGTAFPLDTASLKDNSSLTSLDNLPSFDYAIYLTNTVKFHITQTYHLFEESNFNRILNAIYSSEPPSISSHRLEYIQYSVVMALGKALLGRAGSNAQPPGNEYFLQAIKMFPDITGLCQDPILSVEICCGLALYLQSIDHRNSAYLYLGLALRVSLSQGLHRDLTGGYLDPTEETRHRSAWWTLYILDRKFASLMGAPSSINDGDISVLLPEGPQASQKSKVVDMHVKLSRLMAKVINTVYATDDRLGSSFLRNTQAILRELAKLGDDLAASPELKPGNSSPVGRVSATLNLCYHQCILLATRPLLICLLRDRLQDKTAGGSPDRHTVEPITALLKTSSESASQSLRILAALQSHDLLEIFLPFDLEQIFSSGFIITLISAIHPFPNAVDEAGFDKSLNLLDTLIANGNIPARFRREELVRLHEMLLLVSQQEINPEDVGLDPSQAIPHSMSPNQILSIANLLDSYPDLDSIVGVGTEGWLWETDTAAVQHLEPQTGEDIPDIGSPRTEIP
ncbi:hypothetical protein BHE90_000045 [Fusarium euwallaceae]|uniref:Zn(2)-C6 fungal-type domain-containing protein n=2 Tax=Fusarium solani species complex TaxID=232080 RepID=A0A430MBS3_9HYPO|nr:hypothetical protein CEP51_001771 [Fusarium floridanum]RTE85422.1 hypothetical protein BHE90_000045 [Fusarium euwallaceae]